MTIKALETIHRLLIENEEKTKNAYDLVKANYYQAEEEEENAENRDELAKLKHKTWKSWIDAKGAREEFEAREW